METEDEEDMAQPGWQTAFVVGGSRHRRIRHPSSSLVCWQLPPAVIYVRFQAATLCSPLLSRAEPMQ